MLNPTSCLSPEISFKALQLGSINSLRKHLLGNFSLGRLSCMYDKAYPASLPLYQLSGLTDDDDDDDPIPLSDLRFETSSLCGFWNWREKDKICSLP